MKLSLFVVVLALIQSEERATVTGTITAVNPGECAKLKIDCKQCAERLKDGLLSEDVVADKEGHLKEAFVYVKKGVAGKFEPPKDPITIRMKGGRYEPHVVCVQAGQELVFVNDDDHLYNVKASSASNGTFNEGVDTGKKLARKLEKPDLFEVRDSVHPWMRAWVLVRDNPFMTVTDSAGKFKLPPLPPGKLTIAVAHPLYKTVAEEIEVKAKDDRTLDVTLKERK